MHRYIKEGLEQYLSADPVPWHMPGHKRKALFSEQEKVSNCIDNALDLLQGFDLTEVEGTDDLHHPTGMIKASLAQLSEIYQTAASFYLVNGSTSGIQIAMAACLFYHNQRRGGERRYALLAENCHRSVFVQAELLGLVPLLLPAEQRNSRPEIFTGIRREAVERLLEGLPEETKKSICCAVITSPTYEGMVSETEELAGLLRAAGIFLIADEAHGAALSFCPEALKKKSAVGKADLTVQSLHKTLPALTQTALLHVSAPELVSCVRDACSFYLSSSPSYPFLLSMERAVVWSAEHPERFRALLENLALLKEQSKSLACLKLLDTDDPARLVLFAPGVFGPSLLSAFAACGIVCEMAGKDYVVLIATVMDGGEAFAQLFSAMKTVDARICRGELSEDVPQEKGESLFAQLLSKQQQVSDCGVYAYPPGSYLLRKGEVVSWEKLLRIRALEQAGIRLVTEETGL